jgi:hypothetical protein
MGALSGSHARALMRVPRGNQAEVARAIRSWGFTSRPSDSLVDAYLEAEDETHQRQILNNPERVIFKPGSEDELDWRDLGLSCYAEDLIKTMSYVIQAVQMLLMRLKDQRFGRLDENEQETIYPGFKVIIDGVDQLAGIIREIPIDTSNKQEQA